MKIYLTAIILSLFAIALNGQTSYTIKGSIPPSIKSNIAVMSYPPNDSGGPYKSDTTIIKNGNFEFKGFVDRPQLAELNLILAQPKDSEEAHNPSEKEGNSMRNVALFYLDGNIDIIFDSDGIASYNGGGREEMAWRDYEKICTERSNALNGMPAGMKFFEELIAFFVKKYPDNYVSIDLMDLFTQSSIQPDVVGPMYSSLSKRMQNSEKVLSWIGRLEEAKLAVSGNQPAPEFTINDTEGNPVSLKSYRGSYILVDFWASWCIPCRAENPNVLAAYEKYKDKNFQILGISLDTKKDRWLKAIAEDNLPWKQVCDFKAANSEVAKLYNISSVPANLLIDPEGKIIGKDLKGEALHEKLAKLFE